MDAVKARGVVDPYMRWRNAPFIVEWCNHNRDVTMDLFQRGLDQVKRYHVSMVSSGNFTPSYPNMTAQQRAWFEETIKRAGYRLRIGTVQTRTDLPTTGGPLDITATWRNDGSAPCYENLAVSYRLRNSGGTVAWTGTSTVDVKAIPPTSNGGFDQSASVVVEDTFSLPNLASGAYTLEVRLEHPTSYVGAVALAQGGATADGGYSLGKVKVA
jgi:hypothetical protein